MGDDLRIFVWPGFRALSVFRLMKAQYHQLLCNYRIVKLKT